MLFGYVLKCNLNMRGIAMKTSDWAGLFGLLFCHKLDYVMADIETLAGMKRKDITEQHIFEYGLKQVRQYLAR